MTGTDISVLWEAVFMIAMPFCVVGAGVFLRRRFARPAPGPDGSAAEEPGSRKAARVAGHLLFWGGIFSIVFTLIVFLNFKGVL